MSSDPIFWVYAVIAVTLVGISKGGFGGGLGVVGVPLLAMTTSPATAAAILLPILIVMDFTGLHGWRGRWDREQLGRLIPAALIGIVIGALSFHLFSDDGIRILIGIIGIGFGLSWWIRQLGLFSGVATNLPGPGIRVVGRVFLGSRALVYMQAVPHLRSLFCRNDYRLIGMRRRPWCFLPGSI